MSKQYCYLCRSSTTNSVILVPKNPTKRKLWTKATGVEFSDNNKVCDKHFQDTDFYYVNQNTTKRRRLLPNAVPQKSQTVAFTEHKASAYGNNLFEFSSQTEKEVVESGIALENLRLKIKNKELEQENKRLNQKIQSMVALADALKLIFTESQIRKLESGGKRIKWNSDDIAYAISLHAAGPKAYRHLLHKGFPLPCLSTLDKWLQSVEIKPGPIDFVVSLMQKAVDVEDENKICILYFDKMKLEQPQEYVQVAMAQGLRKSWKHPIYFDYNKSMTSEILHMLIRKLYTAGYHVVAMVSGTGPASQKLWTSLGVSIEKTWFEHPANQEMKVFVFADVHQLINQIRNHFLDAGLVVGGKLLNQETIKQVTKYATSSDLSNLWKITEDHLNVRSEGRQNVKWATQLLSHTTASAIRCCHSLGVELYNPSETADFIQLVNDWFDIFNANLSTAKSIPTKKPFGQSLNEQLKVLAEMTALISTPLLPNAKKCLSFQKGVIVSNTSLELMYQYLVETYKIDYLITSRISQEHLEQFFDAIRSHGSMQDPPSTMDFKFRLRKYLLANSCVFVEKSLV